MPESLSGQPLTPADFRRVAGTYATGIAVVTTLHDGVAHAMTANSFTTVSLNPLMVSFCAQHGTRFRAAVIASGFWAASFLTVRQIPLARWFATRGRPLADQFHGIPILISQNGSPVLAESLGAIAATTVQSVAAGDHDILIGEVSQLLGRRTLPKHDLRSNRLPEGTSPEAARSAAADSTPADLTIGILKPAGPAHLVPDPDTAPCVYFQSAYGSWLREPPRHPNI